jgi:hypothetical protein
MDQWPKVLDNRDGIGDNALKMTVSMAASCG